MPQARPGIRDVLQEIEKHKDEPWTEQDFDIAAHDDRCRGKYDDWNRRYGGYLLNRHRGGGRIAPSMNRWGTAWRDTAYCTICMGSKLTWDWQS